MSGMVARPYIGMARESPCVVPKMRQNSISINEKLSGTSARVDEYGGNGWAQASDVVLCNFWWLRALNAFVASTNSSASRLSDSKADLVACAGASMPEI